MDAKIILKSDSADIKKPLHIAKERINQIITQGGKEVKPVLPKILRGAIEDV